MSKVADLLVSLNLNSASLVAGLAQAKTALGGFGEQVEGLDHKLKSLTQMEGFKIGKEAIEGIAEFVQKGAEAAAQMGILAKAAGVPVEAFSKLSYAANLSGVSTEDLSGVFNKLNKHLGEAGAGVPAQVALFNALGISVRDTGGHVKNAAVVMGELAGKFSGMEDGASKAALEMAALGKTGSQLDEMMALGAEGLKKAGDEADRFGITVGPEAAEAAHRFEQNLTKLQLAGNSVGKQVAANLAPALTKLTDDFLNSKTGAESLKEAVAVLTTAIKVAASTAVVVAAAFDGVGTWIGLTAAKIAALAHGDLAEVRRANDELAASLKKTGDAMKARLSDIWTDAAKPAEEEHKKISDASKTSADQVIANFEAGKKAIAQSDEALKGLRETLDAWSLKVAEHNKSPIEALEASLNGGKIGKQLSEIGEKADAMRWSLEQAGLAMIDLTAKDLSLKINFDTNRAKSATSEQVTTKSLDYLNAELGSTVKEILEQARGGFKSFDDAISEYARNTNLAAKMTGRAEELRAIKDVAGANASTLLADNAKIAADHALKAAEGFKATAQFLVEMRKLDAKIGFEVAQTKTATSRTAEQKANEFGNVGRTAFDVNEQRKGSFDSFGEALDAFTKQTNDAAVHLGEAQKLEFEGKFEAAREETLLATSARNAAEVAGQAADAFKSSAEELHASIVGAASGLVSKLGAAGDVINGAAQGFSSGGPVGAIIGAIAAIVSKLQAFSIVSDSMNKYLGKVLGMIDGTIGPVVKAFVAMSEAFTEVTKTILQASGALEIIYAVLFVVSKIFDALGLAALYVGKFFTQLTGGNTTTIDGQIKDMLHDITSGYHQMDPEIPTLPGATSAIDKLGTAAAKAADKFGEMNTNIPSGYKLGAAQFKSTAAGGPGGGAGGGAGDSEGPAWWHASGNAATHNHESAAVGSGVVGAASSAGSASGLSVEEAAMWMRVYNAGLINGLPVAAAAAAANAYVASNKNGTQGAGWGSGSAPAAGGAHPPSGQAYGADGQRNDVPSIYIDTVHLGGAKDLDGLVRVISSVQDSHASSRHRNPQKAKK